MSMGNLFLAICIVIFLCALAMAYIHNVKTHQPGRFTVITAGETYRNLERVYSEGASRMFRSPDGRHITFTGSYTIIEEMPTRD